MSESEQKNPFVGKPGPIPKDGTHIVYLVDTENTGRSWSILSDIAENGDTVILFVSKNSHTVSLTAFCGASERGVDFRFVECETGTNAMDFQIVAALGRLSALSPQSRYVIFSADAGYDPAIHFLCDRGVQVSRFTNGMSAELIRHSEINDPDPEPEPREPADSGQDNNPRYDKDLVEIPCAFCGNLVSPGSVCATCGHIMDTSVISQLPPAPAAPELIQVPAAQNEQPSIPKAKPAEKPETAASGTPSTGGELRREYRARLSACGITDNDNLRILAGIIVASMRKPKNRRRTEAYNRILARYGQKDGLVIYRKAKDVIQGIAEKGPFPKNDLTPDEIKAEYVQEFKRIGLDLPPEQYPRCANILYHALQAKNQQTQKKTLRNSLSGWLGAKKGQSLTDKLMPVITSLTMDGLVPDSSA